MKIYYKIYSLPSLSPLSPPSPSSHLPALLRSIPGSLQQYLAQSKSKGATFATILLAHPCNARQNPDVRAPPLASIPESSQHLSRIQV